MVAGAQRSQACLIPPGLGLDIAATEQPRNIVQGSPRTFSTDVSCCTDLSPCIVSGLKELAYRIGSFVRALLLTLLSLFLFIGGTLLICIPKCGSLGYEMWMNAIFGLKLAKDAFLENFTSDPFYNSFGLLTGQQGVFKSEFAWRLNLGLMRRAYESTDDQALKEQIKFLAANYLAKAAPCQTQYLRLLNSGFDLTSQISPFTNRPAYHRWSCRDDFDQGEKFNQNLALAEISPLILTDSDEITEPFHLGFTVFTPQDERTWITEMQRVLDAHFEKEQNAENRFKEPVSFLFDLTTLFAECMNNKGRNAQALEILSKFQANFNGLIDQVASQYPDIDQRKLKDFIRASTTCISRVKLEGIGGVKLLPLTMQLTGKALAAKSSAFCDFIDATGLCINRLNLYRYVLKDEVFAMDTRYAVKSSPKEEEAYYFSEIEDLLRNIDEIGGARTPYFGENQNSYVTILGNATLQLLRGWIQEVGQKRWEEITENPTRRKILDATLYKIKVLLATARSNISDYSAFVQAIELIHNELVILLEMTSPFREEDFSDIYTHELDIIPTSLKKHVRAGVARAAMNVFTGVHSAINKMVQLRQLAPVKTTCHGLYFEEESFMGGAHPIARALADETLTRVDLYSTQYNSNIRIETSHTHYQVTDVEGDIRRILETKRDTKHLTVSVDCTVDYFNSKKVEDLLRTFEQEILDGRLNFVFLRSGQKFEMFGMDNYYGSPFYIVNNGGKQWAPFDNLFQEKTYKTDSLSIQWFCLMNRYASEELDDYRHQVFTNSRAVLDAMPEALLPKGDPLSQRVRINTVDEQMNPLFLDIKITGLFHRVRACLLLAIFHHNAAELGIKSDSRAGFGFFHPNLFTILTHAIDDSTSVRITPGLNPEENQMVIDFFQDLLARS